MAMASLRFDANTSVQETKNGAFIDDGNATRFHEWEFRTEMRCRSCKTEDLPKAMNSIIESLRGEAALVAMDIGIEKLMSADGPKTLADELSL